MKKILMITMGMILIISLVVALQIDGVISLDKIKKDKLNEIGIDNPTISKCEKLDEFNCEASIYQKGGINKKIKIITQYCETYETIYSNGECLNYSYTESQGGCLSYDTTQTQGECLEWDENQTKCLTYDLVEVQGECLEYETIQTQGDCLTYNILESQGDCSKWKKLSKSEIEDQLLNQSVGMLENIADIQGQRDKLKEFLTDEINVEIREK